MVTVNGESKNAAGLTVAEFLEENGYRTDRVAVEINLEIVRKSDFATTVIKDGDSIEVVSFVGGG